jgi:hypothetical protein
MVYFIQAYAYTLVLVMHHEFDCKCRFTGALLNLTIDETISKV